MQEFFHQHYVSFVKGSSFTNLVIQNKSLLLWIAPKVNVIGFILTTSEHILNSMHPGKTPAPHPKTNTPQERHGSIFALAATKYSTTCRQIFDIPQQQRKPSQNSTRKTSTGHLLLVVSTKLCEKIWCESPNLDFISPKGLGWNVKIGLKNFTSESTYQGNLRVKVFHHTMSLVFHR